MIRRNKKGLTWREHAAPYLSRALKQAAKTWRPKTQRTDKKKVEKLRKQRGRINELIRKELTK